MKRKFDKIYALFNYNVVFSEGDDLEAITGYDLMNVCEVLSVADVISWIRKRNGIQSIPPEYIYVFTNPIQNMQWFVGRRLIATKSKNDTLPCLRMVLSGNCCDAIATDFSIVEQFQTEIKDLVNVHKVISIGYLSYPNEAKISYTSNMKTVKLPLIL